jgi:hypothetical protein
MIPKGLIWVGRGVLVTTMIGAGGHTFYYLYYWQWQRAQIAGTLFVATLVIGATSLLLSRVRQLEREISRRLTEASDDLAATAISGTPVPTTTGSDGAAPVSFPWLAPEFSPSRYQALVPAMLAAALAATTPRPDVAVFIPVLLGAGLLVSFVAGLAERTATAVNTRTTPAVGAIRRLVIGVMVTFLIVGVAMAGIWWVAHYRPVALGAGTTVITVQVSAQAAPRPAEEAVEIVGRYCARNAIEGVVVRRVEPAASGTAVLVVAPLLDEQAQRRYGGCLQDANLEEHWLTVTEIVLAPGDDQP